MLGRQLWVGRGTEAGEPERALAPERFKAPGSRYSDSTRPSCKPRGGLWTSTLSGEQGSAWVQWCLSEGFDCDREDPTWPSCWGLDPDPQARIVVIDSYGDLRGLCLKYGRTHTFGEDADGGPFHDTYPDWTLLAEHYDAVHMTEEGQWATRLSEPLNLYGWDCESTLWLRWAFTSVKLLGAVTFKPCEYAQ